MPESWDNIDDDNSNEDGSRAQYFTSSRRSMSGVGRRLGSILETGGMRGVQQRRSIQLSEPAAVLDEDDADLPPWVTSTIEQFKKTFSGENGFWPLWSLSQWLVNTDLYATLGISANASQEDIRRVFRQLVGIENARISIVNAEQQKRWQDLIYAYFVLSNNRKFYDWTRFFDFFFAPKPFTPFKSKSDFFYSLLGKPIVLPLTILLSNAAGALILAIIASILAIIAAVGVVGYIAYFFLEAAWNIFCILITLPWDVLTTLGKVFSSLIRFDILGVLDHLADFIIFKLIGGLIGIIKVLWNLAYELVRGALYLIGAAVVATVIGILLSPFVVMAAVGMLLPIPAFFFRLGTTLYYYLKSPSPEQREGPQPERGLDDSTGSSSATQPSYSTTRSPSSVRSEESLLDGKGALHEHELEPGESRERAVGSSTSLEGDEQQPGLNEDEYLPAASPTIDLGTSSYQAASQASPRGLAFFPNPSPPTTRLPASLTPSMEL